MINRKLFISDIHGQLETLKSLLNQVAYDPNTDKLILLGDYIGQSGDSLACLLHILDLVKQNNVVALMGNHDLNLWKYMESRGRSDGNDRRDSTNHLLPKRYSYAASLAHAIETQHPELIAFLGSLPLWYNEEDFLAVHAGINPGLEDWRMSSVEDFTSIRDPFLASPLMLTKPVVFGHTPCTTLHGSPHVWYGLGKIGIDGGAGRGGQLNCLMFANEQFTSTSVPVFQ